jgi:hypothetical protein
VQLQAGGANWGSRATVAPFSLTLDTSTLTNGIYALQAAAIGAAGTIVSAPISVTVNNVAPSTAF